MIPIKRLYVVAGFDGQDTEKTVSEVQRLFGSGSVRFVTRQYPRKPEKQSSYLRELVQSVNDLVFGAAGTTNFCRRLDQTCSLGVDKSHPRLKRCDRGDHGGLACARSRPAIIVAICADHLYRETLDRLGRGVLILPLSGRVLPSAEDLKAIIDEFDAIASAVITSISNRSKSLYAPLIPDRNFQRLGGASITAEAQADLGSFDAVMKRHHEQLYRADFKNPRKSGVRGAYMLDADTAFQEDHLHQTVQWIGAASRADAFHLLNAYHLYGVKTDPGFHFDVMNKDGDGVGHSFEDALTHERTAVTEKHLNITPCDRVL